MVDDDDEGRRFGLDVWLNIAFNFRLIMWNTSSPQILLCWSMGREVFHLSAEKPLIKYVN